MAKYRMIGRQIAEGREDDSGISVRICKLATALDQWKCPQSDVLTADWLLQIDSGTSADLSGRDKVWTRNLMDNPTFGSRPTQLCAMSQLQHRRQNS